MTLDYKAGDKVWIIPCKATGIVKATLSTQHRCYLVETEYNDRLWMAEADLEPLLEEEPQLKVGDKAVSLQSETILEVLDVDKDDYRCKMAEGIVGWFTSSQIRPLQEGELNIKFKVEDRVIAPPTGMIGRIVTVDPQSLTQTLYEVALYGEPDTVWHYEHDLTAYVSEEESKPKFNVGDNVVVKASTYTGKVVDILTDYPNNISCVIQLHGLGREEMWAESDLYTYAEYMEVVGERFKAEETYTNDHPDSLAEDGELKPLVGSIPADVLIQVGDVFSFGATKYGVDNWKDSPTTGKKRVQSALRHIYKFQTGELIDTESGNHHLVHAITQLLMAQHYINEEI